jgi:hypothetical protein
MFLDRETRRVVCWIETNTGHFADVTEHRSWPH